MIYKVHLLGNRLEAFLKFAALYYIEILFTYSEAEFFSTNYFIYLTDRGSNGISQEEKQRLIKEFFKSNEIDLITPIKDKKNEPTKPVEESND